MCGLPVAGFRIGGMPEMITEENGFLAAEISSDSLLHAIEKALDLNNNRPKIAESAATRFSPENHAAEFIRFASGMLDS
jgi:glycosyltransferase involved in cell wall biosynthesis